VSEVPWQEIEPSVVGLCRGWEGFLDIRKHGGIMRFVRRSARPWRVLAS
jgi:hypothetical protein